MSDVQNVTYRKHPLSAARRTHPVKMCTIGVGGLPARCPGSSNPDNGYAGYSDKRRALRTSTPALIQCGGQVHVLRRGIPALRLVWIGSEIGGLHRKHGCIALTGVHGNGRTQSNRDQRGPMSWNGTRLRKAQVCSPGTISPPRRKQSLHLGAKRTW